MEANKIAELAPVYRAQRFLGDVTDTDFHILRPTIYSKMAFWALYMTTVVLKLTKKENMELLMGYAHTLKITRWVEARALLGDYFYSASLFDAPCMKTWAQVGVHVRPDSPCQRELTLATRFLRHNG